MYVCRCRSRVQIKYKFSYSFKPFCKKSDRFAQMPNNTFGSKIQKPKSTYLRSVDFVNTESDESKTTTPEI